MCRKAGAPVGLATTPDQLRDATHIILPGVGSFDEGMARLRASGLVGELEAQVIAGRKPTLGICLGMQLLGRRSAEGSSAGLGWLPFDNVALRPATGAPLPHMGWTDVVTVRPSALFPPDDEHHRYYFLHSFRARCDDPSDELARSEYGGELFPCAVSRDNLFGVQFHPEKSHRFGLSLLRRFAKLGESP
jgi:glutamine amidotransferase